MPKVTVTELRKYADTLKDWELDNDNPGWLCLNVNFEKAPTAKQEKPDENFRLQLQDGTFIDPHLPPLAEYLVFKTLYLSSADERHFSIDFDYDGLIMGIELL